MTEIYDWLNMAETIAPAPTERAGHREDWARHFAALGLAAHAAFRDQMPTIPRNPVMGSRPELGPLILLAVSATAAACALLTPAEQVADKLWNLTPELGALNGEYEYWLAKTLASLGVNPADLYPWFNSADFEVVPRPVSARPPCFDCAENRNHCEQCGW